MTEHITTNDSAAGPMAGRDIVSMLHNEAKRRPEIKALIERVESLTDDDIAQAVVPLPWFRKALTELRKRLQGGSAQAGAISFADKMGGIVDTPQKRGSTMRWMGEDVEVKVKGSNLPILIKTNQLLFLDGDNECWMSSYALMRFPHPTVVEHSNVTRAEYLAMLTTFDSLSTVHAPSDKPLWTINRIG